MGQCTAENKQECYVPSPGVGHELGILFGFLALMLICMAVYAVLWQVGNKRSLRKERDRIAALRADGHLKDHHHHEKHGGRPAELRI